MDTYTETYEASKTAGKSEHESRWDAAVAAEASPATGRVDHTGHALPKTNLTTAVIAHNGHLNGGKFGVPNRVIKTKCIVCREIGAVKIKPADFIARMGGVA